MHGDGVLMESKLSELGPTIGIAITAKEMQQLIINAKSIKELPARCRADDSITEKMNHKIALQDLKTFGAAKYKEEKDVLCKSLVKRLFALEDDDFK